MPRIFRKKFDLKGIPLKRHPKRPCRELSASSSTPQPEHVVIKAPAGHPSHARWLAWSNDGSRLLAETWSLDSAKSTARDLGESDPIVELGPRRNRQA